MRLGVSPSTVCWTPSRVTVTLFSGREGSPGAATPVVGLRLTGSPVSDPWSSKGLCNVRTHDPVGELADRVDRDDARRDEQERQLPKLTDRTL